MKTVTIRIPEQKLEFFLELVKHLGLEITEEISITEEQKSIVRDRILKSKQNPELLKDWDLVKDDFKID